MKSYARRQASALLRGLGANAREAERTGTPDSIHDLRTSLRRLSECLRTFELFFPGGDAGKLKRELKEMMDLAGDVRNRDVAEELFLKGGALSDKMQARMAEEHREAKDALAAKLKAWSASQFTRRCKRDLKL